MTQSRTIIPTTIPSQYRNHIKILLLGALFIFLITVTIGLLNGLDLVEFDRPTLLAHAHTGALGWITLGVFAISMWLFAGNLEISGQAVATRSGWRSSFPRWFAWPAVITVTLYVYAFYATTGIGRPLTGTLMLGAIVAIFSWIIGQRKAVQITVPHLGILAAMTTLVLGAVIGILLGLQLAGKLKGLTSGTFASHPATMVVGYVILAGMAISEWGLTEEPNPASIDRKGIIQVLLPLLGGLTLIVGALLDLFPLILLNVPLEILVVILFLWRVGPRLRRVRWLEGNYERLFGLGVVFVALNVIILAYLIARYAEDFENIPIWLIFAWDRAMFIG